MTLSLDKKAWLKEVDGLREYFTLFGDHLPEGIKEEPNNLEHRIDEL